MIERAEFRVQRNRTLKAATMVSSFLDVAGSRRAMSPHNSGWPPQHCLERKASNSRRATMRTACTICRPCRVDWVRPTRSSAERWNERVEAGTARRAAISPAGSPDGPSAISSRIKSSLVSWDSAEKTAAAVKVSIFPSIQKCWSQASASTARIQRASAVLTVHRDNLSEKVHNSLSRSRFAPGVLLSVPFIWNSGNSALSAVRSLR